MPLRLKSGFLTSSGHDGRLIMDSGAGDKVVIVTHGALEVIAAPPRVDEFRLQEYIDVFSQIASGKFDAGMVDPNGHVCITSDDIRRWRKASSAADCTTRLH